MNKFIEKWCIKVTEDNLKVVGEWFNEKGNTNCGVNYTDIHWSIGYYFHYPKYTSKNLASFSIESGYTEILFQDFKKLALKQYDIDYCKNPDNKVVINCLTCEEVKKCDEILNNDNAHYYLYDRLPYKNNGQCISAFNKSHSSLLFYTEEKYRIINAKDFINYHMKYKKIIGYKCPIKIEGENITIPIGSLFKKKKENDKNYHYEHCFYYNLPKEIVETWEAVHEEEEKIKIGEYEIKFHNYINEIEIDNVSYYYNEISQLISLMQKGQIKYLNVGCNGQYKVDLELLTKILNKLSK